MDVRWSNLMQWDTVYSADSVEWCPVEPYQNVLVCGTYQLEKSSEHVEEARKQSRLGRIYLFTVSEDPTHLSPIQTIETSGVLDQKWCYHTIQGYAVLAAVTSDGFLKLYRLVDEEGLKLELWVEEEIGKNLLALSLDWSTNKISAVPKLVVSDSGGNVSVLVVGRDRIEKVSTWKSHDFEAWIAAYNYWNTDIFYSGGDDCVFKSYDTRIPDVAVTINTSHEAGVTALRCHTDVEHQLLSGSYDEKVRLWDTRSMRRCVTEAEVGGGVWRLKWHPRAPGAALAACMYGGVRVLAAGRAGAAVAVACTYLEHESIAYGADWRHDRTPHVATCSFYDCSMNISCVLVKPE
ncbi:hypothetical protein ACJJTC_002995 [Scirpophaga incertulas]